MVFIICDDQYKTELMVISYGHSKDRLVIENPENQNNCDQHWTTADNECKFQNTTVAELFAKRRFWRVGPWLRFRAMRFFVLGFRESRLII